MVRRFIIALAAVTFAGAVAASTTADARMSGGGGGGFHGGGFHGGGFRGGSFRGAGFRGGFVGPRNLAFRSGFAPRFNRFAFARFIRFHHRRFAFAAAPFVGVGLYGGSCWSWQPTAWGWQRVWACGYDYGYY